MKRFDFSMKLIVLAVCAAIAVNLFYTPKTDIVSAEDTEMRGIWVASVGNLDYPQSPTADGSLEFKWTRFWTTVRIWGLIQYFYR